MPKLVWRVKLVAELRPGVMTESEVARIERDEEAGMADLGLRLTETKQLTAALQAKIVPAQVAVMGERPRCCPSCGHKLASKGHYPVAFRSLFGDVPVRVPRLLVCPCQGPVKVKSFGVLDLGHDGVAPELAYVTARYAALVPFGKVAVLLSELLPTSGAQNAGTVRNRTRRVGEKVVRQHPTEMATQTATPQVGAVVVGLDGCHVRSRHRQEERHFEVIAGKVIDVNGTQHRFAFARNGQAASAEAFAQALSAAGVHADTPATVLCDGDAGLWRLQREALPAATVVLDWWHVAIRFEHARQTARGLGPGAVNADLANDAVHNQRAKLRLQIPGRRGLLASRGRGGREHGRHRPSSEHIEFLGRRKDMLECPLCCPASTRGQPIDGVVGVRSESVAGEQSNDPRTPQVIPIAVPGGVKEGLLNDPYQMASRECFRPYFRPKQRG